MRGGRRPAQVEANFAARIAQGVLEPIREPWCCVAALSWQRCQHHAHPAANVREPRRPGVGTCPSRGVSGVLARMSLRNRRQHKPLICSRGQIIFHIATYRIKWIGYGGSVVVAYNRVHNSPG